MDKKKPAPGIVEETSTLSKLGSKTPFSYSQPDKSILEAFPNRYPNNDYVVCFEHPEFTSLCPMTGQPDFGTIFLSYVPDKLCLESKAFKLYIAAFRNHGAFMESITNRMASDLIDLLKPRRLTLKGDFNTRGGTKITVRVEYTAPDLDKDHLQRIEKLW